MRITLILFSLLFSFALQAQDPDFSQYYATPLSLNPALAGSFNGTYRIGGIYRDAWRAPSPVPITTYAFNGEYRFQLGLDKKKPDFAGAGLRFFSDRTSIIEQNTNAISALFAFHKSLNQYNHQYLSIGFEAGITQKNINFENLNFEDQFNGINAFQGATIDDLQPNNFGYGDYSLGLNYSQELNKKHSISIGLTTKHLSNPNVSFWRGSESNNPELQKTNRLGLLYGFQLSSVNQISYRLSLQPRLIAQIQGSSAQIFTGSTVRIDLMNTRKSAFHLGLFIRASQSVERFGLAHVTPFIGFEVSEMLLGLSYDINMRDVSNEYQSLGVFEFSVTYTGEVQEDSAFCPQF